MKRIFLIIICLAGTTLVSGQCTISCGPTPCVVNWINSPATCADGGTIIIPAGVELNFGINDDTWTGTNIEVSGILRIGAPGQVTINSNITIKSGGVLSINSKLNLGSVAGCDYTLIIESGGLVEIVGSTPDRLRICDVEIARGGDAGCNPYPTGPLPYCEPGGGFTGPVDLGETGVLPIELIFFNAKSEDNAIVLDWATADEENFGHFVIQHSVDGFNYSNLTEISGAGYNTTSRNDYSYTHTLPIIGNNYYRLKAVDLDGSYEYFGPVAVSYNSQSELWIHPNPSSSEKVEYKMNFSPGEGDRVLVYNNLGSILADVPVNDHTNVVYFDAPLKAGAYILKYVSQSNTYFARFIVVE